ARHRQAERVQGRDGEGDRRPCGRRRREASDGELGRLGHRYERGEGKAEGADQRGPPGGQIDRVQGGEKVDRQRGVGRAGPLLDVEADDVGGEGDSRGADGGEHTAVGRGPGRDRVAALDVQLGGPTGGPTDVVQRRGRGAWEVVRVGGGEDLVARRV